MSHAAIDAGMTILRGTVLVRLIYHIRNKPQMLNVLEEIGIENRAEAMPDSQPQRDHEVILISFDHC